MFLFRRKKVTIDCFINNELIYNLCKIDHANKFIPQEWKQLPAFVDIKSNNDPRSDMKLPVATAKRCISLTNLFNTGFILPSWTDFDIEVLDDGTVHRQSPMNDLNAEPHPRFLIWDNLYKNYSHTKIYSPWLIREKSGIKFSWNQCDWHNTNRIADCHILSGLIDFKAQHGSHINMFVKKVHRFILKQENQWCTSYLLQKKN